MVESVTDQNLGGRVGARVTGLLVQGKVAATAKLAGHHKQLAAMILDDFFQLTGSELKRTMGPLFNQLADDPDIDPDLRRTLKFVGAGKGQFATMLGNSITGAAVGSGLGLFLTNILQPAVGRAIAGTPHLPLAVADAIQARARGLSGNVDTRFDVLQQGLDENRMDVMVELARSRLDPLQIVDMVNRGGMTEEFASIKLQRLGYTVPDAAYILQLRHVIHTPAGLADLVTFGVLSEEDAAHRANKAGMSTEDFHLLVLGNGQPPSVTDLMEAYRRGIIDKARLERGITQGPVRNEWFDMLEKLRLGPMSTADAIEAAVQGHISDTQSRAIAAQNGLLPEHWQPLYDTAGNPPGVQTMISMWHRGIITRSQLVQGIKESRLKNKYIEPIIKAGERLPPQETIIRLLRQGEITVKRATDLLLADGYAPDVAQAMIASAHHEKTATARELTASQIVALYEEGGLSTEEAVAHLGEIRYEPDVAAELLHLADVRATKRLVDAAVSRIRAGYVSGRIDEGTAATDMDTLRVPPQQRDRLIALWDLERAIPSRSLSEAQLRAAAKAGIITWEDYRQSLVTDGYAPGDADILVALHAPQQQQ